MILITGGCFQGKTDFACRLAWKNRTEERKRSQTGESGVGSGIPAGGENAAADFPAAHAEKGRDREEKSLCVADGETAGEEAFRKADVVTHLEAWIRRLMSEGKDPGGIADRLYAANPEVIVTLQELGCGIVPLDAGDRAWREACGRTGCELAQHAQAVYRVTCGIPQRIR